MRRVIAPIIVGLCLILVGCGTASREAGDARAPEQHAGPEGSGGSAAQDAQPGPADDAAPDETDVERQVIATGDMRVITDSPSEAAGAVDEHGESRGGYVESREEWTDQGGEAVVDITLRVPADEFEQLMTDVAGVGEVAQRSQSAEDVTGAVQDLDARISALEVSTERLEGIMSEAESASDLLEAEQALSERQGELESLVAQRDDLEDQVSMSTLQVELRESDSGGDRGGFAEWLGALGTTLVASAGGLVLVLAALLPWVIVVGVPGWFIARWLIRRNRSRKAAQGRTQAYDRRAAGGDDRTERTDGQKTDAREPTGEASGS